MAMLTNQMVVWIELNGTESNIDMDTDTDGHYRHLTHPKWSAPDAVMNITEPDLYDFI